MLRVLAINKDVCGGRIRLDQDDAHLLDDYTWRIDRNGYVVHSYRHGNKVKRLYLHRLIMKAGRGKVVDHINHNRSDNRKTNLRVCTHQQNMMNRKGSVGVSKSSYGKFRARVKLNGKTIWLGSFSTFEEAKAARDSAAVNLFGDFACLEY